jgi:hypothetical protein
LSHTAAEQHPSRVFFVKQKQQNAILMERERFALISPALHPFLYFRPLSIVSRISVGGKFS